MAAMKPNLGRIFLTGLLTVIPAVATLYLLAWLIGAIDRTFGKPLRWLIPDEAYLAGMGIVVAVMLVFAVGVLMHGVLFRRLFRMAERAMLTVPVVRSIYGAVKDMIGLLGDEKGPALQVVSLTLPGSDWRGVGGPGEGGVSLPMSSGIGGYTVMVPRGAITPIEMSREAAMTFLLTAG